MCEQCIKCKGQYKAGPGSDTVELLCNTVQIDYDFQIQFVQAKDTQMSPWKMN